MRLWFDRFFPADTSRPARAFVAAIFALHLAFALFYVAAIPPLSGPDEYAHVRYVRQLVEERALPVLTDVRQTRDTRTGAIAQHPPLSYLLGAPLYLAARVGGEDLAARALRLASVALGAGTLAVFWLLLRENFPNRRELWPAALAFAALLPHFLLLSSVWNNDGLLIFLSTLWLLYFLRLTRDAEAQTPRGWAFLGLLWGALLLTKATALVYVVPVALFLVFQLARRQRGARAVVTHLGAFMVPGLLIGGWWFVRFYFMIGRIQPIPDLGYENLLLSSPLELLLHPNAPLLAGRFVAGAMRSIWGQVDWTFSPPQRDAMGQTFSFWDALWGPTLAAQPGLFALTLVIYRLAVVATLLAFAGLVMGAVKRRLDAPLRPLALFFGLLYAALGYYTLFKHPGFFEGGRYLLPALAATATLWTAGISFWLPPARQRLLAPALMLFFVVWNVGCAVNLTQVLIPLYAPK